MALLLFLTAHSGGPKSYDELLYLHTAMNLTPDPHILNRYGHIYLLSAFCLLTGNALEAAKVAWAFEIVTTALCIYVAVRCLCPGGILPGIVALLMFFSQRWIMMMSGVPYADYTVMMLVAVACALTLGALRARGNPVFLVAFLLGVLSVWTFRSKETGLCVIMLLPCLFMTERGKENPGRVLRLVLAGMGFCFAVFILLDWLLLGDALFCIRRGSAQALVDFNFKPWTRDRGGFWSAMWSISELKICWILYFMAVFSARQSKAMSCLWPQFLFPIVFLTILTTSSIVLSMTGNEIRYLAPVLPVVCVWVAAYFSRTFDSANGVAKRTTESTSGAVHRAGPVLRLLERDGTLFVLACLAALILYCLAFFPAARIYANKGWGVDSFYSAVYTTLCACGVLLAAGSVFPSDRIRRVLMLSLLLASCMPALRQNLDYLRGGDAVEMSRSRWKPFSDSARAIAPSSLLKIAWSDTIFTKGYVGPRNAASLRWMYNIYFNSALSADHFVYFRSLKETANCGVSHVFLHDTELSEQSAQGVLEGFEVVGRTSHGIVLVAARKVSEVR
jgi:hypothetical protein